MTEISFVVRGTPKGQPRARAFAFKKGGKTMVRVYDPGTAEGWKSAVAEAARPFLPEIPIAAPVRVTCHFFIPRPKSHFRTGKNAGVLRDDAPLHCTSKPDNDNYEKAIWDALVELGMLKDDAFICQNYTSKRYVAVATEPTWYSTSPGAKISIENPV